MSTASSSKPRRSGCPLCGKPATTEHTPFCSAGCRDRDLINWLSDSYRVPGPPADEFSENFDSDGLDSKQ